MLIKCPALTWHEVSETDRYTDDIHQKERELAEECTKRYGSLETLLTQPGSLGGRKRSGLPRFIIKMVLELILKGQREQQGKGKRREEGRKGKGSKGGEGKREKEEISCTLAQIFSSSEIPSFIPDSPKQHSSSHSPFEPPVPDLFYQIWNIFWLTHCAQCMHIIYLYICVS